MQSRTALTAYGANEGLGMEKWLIEELECKARMEQMDIDRKAHLRVKCYEDFAVSNPDEIKSLSIDLYEGVLDSRVNILVSKFVNLESISFGSNYQGEINSELINSWLNVLPCMSRLAFFTQSKYSITWATLAAIDLSRIKSLTVSMHDDSQPIPLIAPVLEEFTCFGTNDEERTLIERSCLERSKYDFSGMPMLQKVKLSRCGFWDYHTLSCLRCLTVLDITDRNLMNLSWLSPSYSLSTLNVSACVEDLTGVETQPMLTKIYLGCNKISDITPLSKLKHLRSLDLRGNSISDVTPIESLGLLDYLNLQRNPLSSEKNLREKGIQTLLISPQDGVIDRIAQIINGFSQQVHWWIRNEDTCDISQMSEWQRNSVLRNRQKPYEERLKEKIQFAFKGEFQKINPFDLHIDDLQMDIRETFVRRSSEKYPFLTVTSEMQSIMQQERNCIITKTPEIPGIIFFVDDDFVRIHVKAKPGSGQIKQSFDKHYVRLSWPKISRKIVTGIKKQWNLFFPDYKFTAFDFEIIYATMYGKAVDEKITFAVMCAMWSAVHQIVLKQKTAVLLKSSASGRLTKEEASLSQIHVALNQGVENIIAWKPKNKSVKNFVNEMNMYNTIEDLLVDMRGYEKVYCKLKELDSFRLKLVDVIQNHISDMNDLKRIQSVLRDFFPYEKRKVNLLILLLQVDILESIKNQSIINGLFVSKFITILENDYGIGVDNAKYAVYTWCLCYGKYVLNKTCDL